MRIIRWTLFGLALQMVVAAPVRAQEPTPVPVVEVRGGMAAFVDENPIGHGVVGAAARFYVAHRLSVGPEVFYMKGPGDDRDLFVMGTVTADLLASRGGRPRLVTPYVMVGGGLLRHSDRFGQMAFSSVELAVTGGAGARVRLGERVQVGGEFRFGWEPHITFLGAVGIALR